ncbi:DNA mismatch repair protein MutL [Trametes pubescens]|uniref:DNA mismatch repair protein MutL n=1 Tax=Trametes pubescens TaxID=154538 RepID=A0A1M2VCI2_TRAPU|nr:DNA mismatch repair protein MutL [Trametes pubescens]
MQTGAHSTADAGPSGHITYLSSSTQSQLRSTQILTSLPQIISELVQNSLDAGARSVDVTLDPAEWECSVRDDGVGISRDGLAILSGGSQSSRYGTSKAYTPASLDEVTTFGFRGEALASAADIACLEISSRTTHSRESWSVILKGGQLLYAGPSIRWRRESPGTVVSIRDAFHNLPIRRRSHPNPSRTIELVKRELEAFALVFANVSFSLENTRRDQEGTLGRSKARVLTVPKTPSTLAAFRHIFGKALADEVEELEEHCDGMRLEGFVSLQGAYSKALDELGKTNNLTSSVRRSPRKTEKKAVYVLNLILPPRFVDNCIEPAKAAVQLQNSSAAASFLSSAIERVLLKHGFLTPRVHGVQPSAAAASPRKRRRLERENYPSGPAQSGTSRSPSVPHHPSHPLPTIIVKKNCVDGGVEEEASPNLQWTDPATGERFVIDARTGNSYPQLAPVAPSSADTSTAPTTRARMTLPSVHRPLSSPWPTDAPAAPAWIAEALSANDTYRPSERKIHAIISSGAEGVDQHACNGAHRRPGAAPTNLPWDAARRGRFTASDLRRARVLGQVDRKFVACIIHTAQAAGEEGEGEGDEYREDGIGSGGERALVLIDQHAADERVRVERFLRELCAPSSRGGALSEVGARCSGGNGGGGGGVRTRVLVPPVNVLLTQVEARAVAKTPDVRSAFARWGVTFASSPSVQQDIPGEFQEGETAYVQVTVATVPEVVADKLLAGDELRDLIKGYLAKLESDGLEGSVHELDPSQGGDGLHEWQRALRHCPRELIELVNSKACRGAIMFNDTLTLEQCRNLLDKLSGTALPFQCAHGRWVPPLRLPCVGLADRSTCTRPSLVPLVDVGGSVYYPSGAPIDWGGFMGPRSQ